MRLVIPLATPGGEGPIAAGEAPAAGRSSAGSASGNDDTSGSGASSSSSSSSDSGSGEPHGGHGSKRAVIAALCANLGIAATKFIAFAITGSASLLAESVHSVADSGDQILLLLGRTRAERAETEEHPFGFGAERYFYAFLVAVVLFVVGAAFSCYEGIERILHPDHER